MPLCVRNVMTEAPYVVDMTATPAEARQLMRDHSIRHLPVLDGKRLVGILSDRDLGRLESIPLADGRLRVADGMSPAPHVVSPQMSVRDMVRAMHARRQGAAVVVDDDQRVIGVFTTTDALALLLQLLTDQDEPQQGSAG